MDHAVALWQGDPPALSGRQFAQPRPSGRARGWSLRIGRDGIAWSSFRESYGPHETASVAASRRFGAGPAVTAVAGGLALLLVGASAGRAWSPTPNRAGAAMVVPDARPFVATARSDHPIRKRRSAMDHPVAPAPAPVLAADAVDAVEGPAAMQGRAQAIERALRTGEFQEWADRDGATGFAVPGTAEVSGAGTCRPLAVLTRQPDGHDSVTNSRSCSLASD